MWSNFNVTVLVRCMYICIFISCSVNSYIFYIDFLSLYLLCSFLSLSISFLFCSLSYNVVYKMQLLQAKCMEHYSFDIALDLRDSKCVCVMSQVCIYWMQEQLFCLSNNFILSKVKIFRSENWVGHKIMISNLEIWL